MSDGVKKGVAAVVALVLVGYTIYSIVGSFGGQPTPADTRTMMDVDTSELVEIPVDKIIGPYPLVNPKTGKKTLYPTEVCYARECGAKGGTHVILNRYLGKKGPTYCPVCGSLVRLHNPGPRKHRGKDNE